MEKSAPLPRVLCSDILSEDMKTCIEPNSQVQRELELGLGPTSGGTHSGRSFLYDQASTEETPAPRESSGGEDLFTRRGAGHVARGCPDN